MKLVIDIPDEQYKLIASKWNEPKGFMAEAMIYNWIKCGTPIMESEWLLTPRGLMCKNCGEELRTLHKYDWCPSCGGCMKYSNVSNEWGL